MINQEFWSPILLSAQVTTVASILAFSVAIIIAAIMKGRSFTGKVLVETIWMLPLVLPPTVVGFGLLLLLGRNSWLGQAIEWLLGQPVVFTWWAAVIAATVVAFPLIYQTLKTGFESVDSDLEDVARSMGAGEVQLLMYVTIPLSWRSLAVGYLLGFARGLGEFGATLMFAGNIPGKTQTIPTAIYLATETGHVTLAAYWVGSIVMFSFLLLCVVHRIRIY
ncbi:molybdate ABC transporter permease subunit [Desmospora activa]|uniref:Molybdenum transport system permease n=1 Tax=Desmospora activa DSM 45169 TaxID=1121389 RepID=A0A2T4ZAV8_9BACL|nr:molybdate ABC transporter permease subunit [Desmospora activa]PTM59033.1 molybdate transport system permease protein [Desmospora activa DSM 45169]